MSVEQTGHLRRSSSKDSPMNSPTMLISALGVDMSVVKADPVTNVRRR